MGCATSLDCKKNSRQIKGFDSNLWETHAKTLCTPGIRAKFQQNVDLMEVLQSKTGAKQIVECTNDSFWGTGMPINKPDCLDQTKWTSQGILGEILEKILQEARSDVPHFNRTQSPQEIVNNPTRYASTYPSQCWNTSNLPTQIAVPLITPTNVPVNRGAQDLQAVTETTPSLNGADFLNVNNTAISVPEPKTSQAGQVESLAAAVTSTIISMVHPMTGTSENAVGESHGSSVVHKPSCEPANEVEMVEETPLKET